MRKVNELKTTLQRHNAIDSRKVGNVEVSTIFQLWRDLLQILMN